MCFFHLIGEHCETAAMKEAGHFEGFTVMHTVNEKY